MDFFQSQERAQARTRVLVGYFILAVICIIAAVYLACALVFLRPHGDPFASAAWLWQPTPLAGVALVTLAIIGGGSAYKLYELSSGGAAVARSLGGVLISPSTVDPAERRLRNVVEEMALASGVPVPDVYVLPDEPGINALAAGHTPSDAIIAVTRGCLRQLTRDELQGVIAHEFSHILNGDMRLNMRLMGVLFGILCLALIGRSLLRADDRKNALPALGLILILIGGIGVFFGKLIKSAVSRQREFLADASAVQFTRNPAGVTGALKKMGGLVRGSLMKAPMAEDASHIFFGNGLHESWFSPLSTHPPLIERIRAIDPSFDGVFPRIVESQNNSGLAAAYERGAEEAPLRAVERLASVLPAAVLAGVGRPTADNLVQATALRASLPHGLIEAARTPETASLLAYAVLLSREEPTRQTQLQYLNEVLPPSLAPSVETYSAALQDLDDLRKLPVMDLAIPALRQLSLDDYEQFKTRVRALIEQDNQIDLLEYTVQKILLRHLDSHFEGVRKPVIEYYVLKPVAQECAVVLSALAHIGQDTPETVASAFQEGASRLNPTGVPITLVNHEAAGLAQVDAALDRLNTLAPMQKKNLLYACAHTVLADREVQPREGALLRAIADALDCPIPPFLTLSGQAAA